MTSERSNFVQLSRHAVAFLGDQKAGHPTVSLDEVVARRARGAANDVTVKRSGSTAPVA